MLRSTLVVSALLTLLIGGPALACGCGTRWMEGDPPVPALSIVNWHDGCPASADATQLPGPPPPVGTPSSAAREAHALDRQFCAIWSHLQAQSWQVESRYRPDEKFDVTSIVDGYSALLELTEAGSEERARLLLLRGISHLWDRQRLEARDDFEALVRGYDSSPFHAAAYAWLGEIWSS